MSFDALLMGHDTAPLVDCEDLSRVLAARALANRVAVGGQGSWSKSYDALLAAGQGVSYMSATLPDVNQTVL